MQGHCGYDCNCLLRKLGTFGTIVFSMPRFATTGTVCYWNGCRHRQPAYGLVDNTSTIWYDMDFIKELWSVSLPFYANMQHRSYWYGIHFLYFPYRYHVLGHSRQNSSSFLCTDKQVPLSPTFPACMSPILTK